MEWRRPKVREIVFGVVSRWPIFGFWLRGQNVGSPIVGISSIPENVHFPWRNPSGTDTKFVAKWTPKNYSMYHSNCTSAPGDGICDNSWLDIASGETRRQERLGGGSGGEQLAKCTLTG